MGVACFPKVPRHVEIGGKIAHCRGQRGAVRSMLQADAVLQAHMEDSDGEEIDLTMPGGQARKA